VIQPAAFALVARFAFVAAFFVVFFCRPDNRLLSTSRTLATLGFWGTVIPTAAAIVPAAAPMFLAAAIRIPSGGFFVSLFFAMC
jgi:hypothetical protein